MRACASYTRGVTIAPDNLAAGTDAVDWRSISGADGGAGGAVRLGVGDWLGACAGIEGGTIDMVYVDPPFNSGRTHAAKGGAFDDRFAGIDGYLDWLGERLAATKDLVSTQGNILVHVDWRTSHRVRVVLDELFGAEHFVNHLVWTYGLGGSSPRRFARKHDDILFYCVDPERYWFEPPMVPATSRRMAGQMKKATDVLDIPALNNMASERVGWPTQKPLALLEMLVGACCPPGGTVLDPCCGSGTTVVAAAKLGRKGIGVDIAPEAIEIAADRVADVGGGA